MEAELVSSMVRAGSVVTLAKIEPRLTLSDLMRPPMFVWVEAELARSEKMLDYFGESALTRDLGLASSLSWISGLSPR